MADLPELEIIRLAILKTENFEEYQEQVTKNKNISAKSKGNILVVSKLIKEIKNMAKTIHQRERNSGLQPEPILQGIIFNGNEPDLSNILLHYTSIEQIVNTRNQMRNVLLPGYDEMMQRRQPPPSQGGKRTRRRKQRKSRRYRKRESRLN